MDEAITPQLVSFRIYYKKIKGAEIVINFDERYVCILDDKNQVVSKIIFSKKISHAFSSIDLLADSVNVGEKYYWVVLNGHNGNNWLTFNRPLDVLSM